ncbi:MAG TPA: MATE family efflux transporter [Geminicoccaceae bacterium]|nr:MATE family efflux transporter [Geminicoccaceae bacterium]
MQGAVGHRSGWRGEARALIALSGPLVLTNLGQVAIQTTDVLLIGWLGTEALAASVLGVNLSFVLLLFSIGVVTATAPMIAQDLGRQRHAVREPRRTVRQGFWVALLLGVPASLILWNIAPILALLRQDPALIGGAEDYVHAAMWGFVPGLWFVVLRNFIASLERPRAGMVIMLVGVSFNAVAAYGLIFGRLGLPALGLRGAGIAAALTNVFLFVALLGFVLIDRRFRRYYILGRFWRTDWSRLREIFRIGLPIGVTLIMEVGLFAGSGFLIGAISTTQLAAHQIALQCAAVSFMVPLGLAQAATVRVGLAVGRSDPAAVLRAGTTALIMGSSFMLAMALVMWSVPRSIVGLFIDAADPANRAVVHAAVTFLAVAAMFQIFDGGQVVGAGALRGLKDTRWPMLFAAFAYWAVGMVCAVGLGLGAGLGGLGVWFGLAAGLAVAAALMIGRFYLLQGRIAGGTRRLAASGGLA